MRRGIYAGVVYWLIFLALIIWAVSGDISQPPQEPRQQQHETSSQKKPANDNPFNRFWEWSTHDPVAFFTFVLAIFTGCLVVVSSIQIKFLIRADESARRSADAAKAAADASMIHAGTTREALIADQRAWIVTSLSINGPFNVSQYGVSVRVIIRNTNIGRTAALRVHSNVALILDGDHIEEKVMEFCDENKKRIHDSRIVSPNESYDRPWYASVDWRVVDRYSPQIGRKIFPHMLVCVTYELLQDKDLKQTASVYYSDFFDAVIGSHEIECAVGPGGFAT